MRSRYLKNDLYLINKFKKKMSLNRYISRIGDGVDFNKSKEYGIWGYNRKTSKKIISNIKKDDPIIFIKNGGGINIIGMALFENYKDILISTNNVLPPR